MLAKRRCLHRRFISEAHHDRRPVNTDSHTTIAPHARRPNERIAPMPALISRSPQRALAVLALVLAALIAARHLAGAERPAPRRAPDVSVVQAMRGDVIVSVGGVGRIVTGGVAAIDLPASAELGHDDHRIECASSELRAGRCRVLARDRTRRPGARQARAARRRRVRRWRCSTTTAPRPRPYARPGSISRPLASSSSRSSTTIRRRASRRRPPSSRRRRAAVDLGARRPRSGARPCAYRRRWPPRGPTCGVRRPTSRRCSAGLAPLAPGRSRSRGSRGVAQKRLDRVLAPGTPTDVSAAQAEVKKAEADLAVLQKPPATPLPEEIAAAQAAVTVAQADLAAAQAAAPPDPAAVGTAQLELDKALAALAALKPPLAQELASAQAARGRGAHEARVASGVRRDPADVAAARQELAAARAEVRTLRAGPGGLGLAAARGARRLGPREARAVAGTGRRRRRALRRQQGRGRPGRAERSPRPRLGVRHHPRRG